MNKISIMITSIILATGLVITSTSTLALPAKVTETEVKYKKHNGKKNLQHRRLERRLDLTDQQKVQIKLINKMSREERIEHQQYMKTHKEQFNSLLITPVFDQQAFIDLQDQYQSHFNQVALLKAKYKHAYMQVLDKEQQEKKLLMQNKVKRLF